MRIRTAANTDIGKIREENEDRFLCDDELRLYAVADGIGGLAGGAEAAEEAVTQLLSLGRALPKDGEWDFPGMIRTINQQVVKRGQTIDRVFGIGTTFIAARLLEGRLQLAHVGDSSCFLHRDGILEKLTLDHTVENEMCARHGQGAANHLSMRTRNALTRCVGQPKSPEADILIRPLNTGDRILLCSDGITRFIQEPEIASVLGRVPDPTTGIEQMIALASTRGGFDNATGVLIFVDEV
jgi:serine/threonine protein phosphatase PrpC